MRKVVSLLPASRNKNDNLNAPSQMTIILRHDERHLRRRTITLSNGNNVLIDFASPVVLQKGDILLLDNGERIEIGMADEPLYSIRARDHVHLAELAWHIGNRHLAASIEAGRILILRDHVIKTMLEGLGAVVEEVVATFNPVRGAYSEQGGHHHGHEHPHARDEGHHNELHRSWS
jgi:urease accessory protein